MLKTKQHNTTLWEEENFGGLKSEATPAAECFATESMIEAVRAEFQAIRAGSALPPLER